MRRQGIGRIFLGHLELLIRNILDLLRQRSKILMKNVKNLGISKLTLTLPSLAPVANLFPSGENAIDHASAGPPSIHLISVPS